VRTSAGDPLANASVTATGPKTSSTSTDATGTFSLTVTPGLYRIEATKSGYLPASLGDYTAVSGSSSPLAITMNQPDLTSLQTIGRSGTAARGSAINTGAAASTYLSGAAFSNSANAQINTVLQHIPDVTIQHMSSQQDTTIILGGAQPYETQVLIDGRRLALGQYGVWASQYFPSFLAGDVETQSGPSNTTPFANLAVGGTVNLLSPSFTKARTAELSFGVDSYNAQYSNFLTTGSLGKLAYVVGAGVNGYNGLYYQETKCLVTPDNGGAQDNLPGNTGIVQKCLDSSGSFFNKGEVLKLRYDFTPATSFEVGGVGAWGGYNPQGSAWGQSVGPITIEPCLAANPQSCNNPASTSLIGETISGYTWYTGSSLYNNQTLFDAQFRTAIGPNTFLIRPYIADIEPEVILGAGQTQYPVSFSPVGAPNDPKSAFAANCNAGFGSTTDPSGATVLIGGQTECFNGPYTTYEQDKLYGSTFSFLHPMGESLLNFTYDFHGQSTFAYIDTPTFVSVPFSTDRYSTFSLTGDFHVLRNVGINLDLYDTTWNVIGVQRANPASLTDTTLTGLNRKVSRFDPHVAFTFPPMTDVAFRAAAGSSATFPYVGQVSGLATYQTPAISLGPPYSGGGTLTEKNPNLLREVSVAYSLGMDKRFGNGSVASLDLQSPSSTTCSRRSHRANISRRTRPVARTPPTPAKASSSRRTSRACARNSRRSNTRSLPVAASDTTSQRVPNDRSPTAFRQARTARTVRAFPRTTYRSAATVLPHPVSQRAYRISKATRKRRTNCATEHSRDSASTTKAKTTVTSSHRSRSSTSRCVDR